MTRHPIYKEAVEVYYAYITNWGEWPSGLRSWTQNWTLDQA